MTPQQPVSLQQPVSPQQPLPRDLSARVTHAEAVPEPVPRAETATAGALAVADGPAAALGAAGLSELATAFTANAQALQGVGALQVQLLEALKRSDRSELVLASAQGLNDSFRTLAAIQKALLEQLEKLRAPAPVQPGRAVPMLLLGLCAVVVLATWALVGAIQDFGAAQPDAGALTEQTARMLQAGRDEAGAAARQEAQRLQSIVADGEERARTLQDRLDLERENVAQQQRDLSAKEAELDALRRQASAAQNEALKMVSLENEIKLLNSDAALVEPRLRGLERELEEQRRENTTLRKRIASSELGYEEPAGALPPSSAPPSSAPPPRTQPPSTPPSTQPPSTPPPDGARPTAKIAPLTGPPPGAPPPEHPGTVQPLAPPTLAPPTHSGAASGGDGPVAPGLPGPSREPFSSRDPQVVEQVRTTLNTLLAGARTRRPDTWTFARVDGVAPDRLRGVLAQRHDSSGSLLETVEAREALVWVDPVAQKVFLELVDGVRNVQGQRGDFREGRLEAVVAEGEAASLFLRSGLRQVRTR